MRRPRAWPWLILLCSLAFGQRAAIVTAPKAYLYGKPAGGDLGIRIGEEIARGNLAADLLEGPILPLIDYQYTHFFGGSLVTGLLVVPSFALFGQRLWALKLVPVLLHVLAVGLLFRLLDRHVSRRAAVFGGALFALSPPGYALLSTVAWGSHVESNVLALLAANLFLDLRGHERRVARRFVLGVVLGFGLYFGYQFALVIAALGLLDLPRRNRPGPREVASQAAGALVGFLPWLVYNLRFDFAGLRVYDKGLGGHLADEAITDRLGHLLAHGLPGALFTGVRWLDLVLAGALALAAGIGLATRTRAAWLAAAYGGLFVLAFAVSDFNLGHRPETLQTYRYAMLLAPWVAVGAGAGLDRLAGLAGAATQRLVGAAVVVLAGTFLVTSWRVSCDFDRLGADVDAPGAQLDSHGRWVSLKYLDHPERIPAVVERIVERRGQADQRVLFEAIGTFLRNQAPRERDPELAKRMRYSAEVYRAHVPPEYEPAFQRKRAGSR